MKTIETPKALNELVGHELGVSDWIQIDQARVDLFAEATGDHQWIHTDPERAARELPTGGTIVHGYLILSLAPTLIAKCVHIQKLKSGINYGCNKVRFTSMVPTGSNVRGRVALMTVMEKAGGQQATFSLTVEVEGQDQPACLAEVVAIFY